MPRRVDADLALATFRAAGLEPLEPFPGASKPWRSVHQPCGRTIAPTLSNMRRRASACRGCAAERRGAGRRAGKQVEAVATMRAAGFSPLEPYLGNNTPWRCRHDPCGCEVTARLATVVRGDTACRTCSATALGYRIWTPELAEATLRAADLEPLEPYPGSSSTPWRPRHTACSRVVARRLGNVAAGQGGCNVCGRGTQAETARNDPDPTAAVVRADHLEPYPGVHAPWRCRSVPCGQEVSPSYSNIKRARAAAACAIVAASFRLRMSEQEARGGGTGRTTALPLRPRLFPQVATSCIGMCTPHPGPFPDRVRLPGGIRT